MFDLNHALVVAFLLFGTGVAGVLLRRNAIVVFMSIELMLNAVNLVLVTFSRLRGDLDAQVLCFFVMAVAAAEAAIGLGIVIALFRRQESIDLDQATLLRS
ncbi:MAG: NADH-quinone oxidoreductase subunit NuoK [Candidatus Krumholzibacteriia bacterium]|nr:NADH-quinone oxidoreductase subunit NuoK [bacterium]MCB9513825.1 NADH-quinone oxidoreductase subunit NuoK [Candidatus Latescibacterota bacterium]MCB9515298.1 NADH-quinone oxidoreductase subunit NuoK [Candidatus Latescibacterota bacterium]